MRKTALVLIMLMLISVMVGAPFVEVTKANPYYEERRSDPPVISILSPVNGTNVNGVQLNFTVAKPEWWVGTSDRGRAQTLDSVVIEIDGKYYRGASGFDSSLATPFDYAAILTDLADGNHNLTVRAYATGYVVEIHGLWDYTVPINSSSVVHFTLDTVTPRVSNMSIENKTYDETDLSLNFTVNEPCQQFSYVLDGRENVTVAGNTTLTGLSLGKHSITVYARDASGNRGTSETINFTIAEPEPFPATLLIGSAIAVAAVVGLGLLVYLKKHGKCKTQ